MDIRIAGIIEQLERLDNGDGVGRYGREQLVPMLKKLGSARQCEVVWPAIERRIEDAERIHKERVLAIFGGTDYSGPEIWRTCFEEEVCWLAEGIEEALSPAPMHVAATKSERRKLLDQFASAADRMRDVFAKIQEEIQGEKFRPQAFDNAMRVHAVKSADGSCDCFADAAARGDESELGRLSQSPYARELARQAAETAVYDPFELLDSMQSGIDTWANEVPMIPKPGDQNAARLKMIRSLTGGFRERYGTPLRAQVLAITGVFYDTTTLTEADIAKLAP